MYVCVLAVNASCSSADSDVGRPEQPQGAGAGPDRVDEPVREHLQDRVLTDDPHGGVQRHRRGSGAAGEDAEAIRVHRQQRDDDEAESACLSEVYAAGMSTPSFGFWRSGCE